MKAKLILLLIATGLIFITSSACNNMRVLTKAAGANQYYATSVTAFAIIPDQWLCTLNNTDLNCKKIKVTYKD